MANEKKPAFNDFTIRLAQKTLWLATVLYQIIVILAGLGVVLYVCVWLMLFGGIADAINLFKTSAPISASDVAIVFAKILLALPLVLLGWVLTLNIAGAGETFFINNCPLTEEEYAEQERERRIKLGYEE